MLTERQWGDVLEEVLGSVREVGRFILSQFGQVTTTHADIKEKNSLVSFVDTESERRLIQRLSTVFPKAGYVTEEKTTAQDKSRALVWIIDPLDGTTNFLRGVPIFSISLALTHHSELVLAVVYDIYHDRMYHAQKGRGAYMDDKQLCVSGIDHFEEAIIATGFPYMSYDPNSAMFDMLREVITQARGMRRMGSAAIDLAQVASGVFDGYYEARLNPWDLAAGILLVQEAGGHVGAFRKGCSPLDTGNIVAANPYIYRELMKRLSNNSAEDVF